MSRPDPIGDFLNRDFACAPDEPLRAALRQRTTFVLRRRRRLKRAALALGLLLPAAIGVGWFLATLGTEEQPEDKPVAPVVVKVTPRETPKELPGPALSPAERLHAQALHDIAEQAASLLRAGDSYLEADDCDAALRCYRQYLTLAGPEALVIADTDNWLLVALKNARRKEQVHAE
jgi:hypothetical protein